MVTQWYPPEPAHIPATLAAGLAGRGHEVRVLTGYPNYPGGKLYPGYRQRWNTTTGAGGVTVRRVPLYTSHDASAVRRVGNYLSFAASSSAAAPGYLGGVDVVYAYLSPATAFAAPALLRRLRGTPVVVHVQDLWPESVTQSSMAPAGAAGRFVDRSLHAALRAVYRAAAAVVVIAPTMLDRVVERGADPATAEVVLNWADENQFRPMEATAAARAAIGRRDRCTVMYAGAMGSFQNIEDAVRAAAAVGGDGGIDLVLAGSGTHEAAARALATQLKADNVRFVGRHPQSEMAALYAAADYQLITLRDLPMFHGTVPSKLQAALACGSPVVVAAPGDAAALVENAGAGLACPPEDWRALADRFRQVAKTPPDERADLSRRALHLYRTRMSQQSAVDRFEELLARAAG